METDINGYRPSSDGTSAYHIKWFDTLESTNNYCKLLDLNDVEEFTVICAASQTAGIGQRGNVWVSEPYKNLTFSIILKPTFLNPASQYQLTVALSVAVAEALESLLDTAANNIHIKWPNDIYVGDRKICGTLTSNSITSDAISCSICGIGLNVNQTSFPDWLPNPTSMALVAGQPFGLEPTLLHLLNSLRRCYNELQNGNNTLRSRYMSRLYRLGMMSNYSYKGEPLRATIADVNDFGHLRLVTEEDKEITCTIKELVFC